MRDQTNHVYIKTFFNRKEAYDWCETIIAEYDPLEWHMLEYRIVLLGGGIRAGLSFSRRWQQLELDV